MHKNHSVNSSGPILRGAVQRYSRRSEVIPSPSCSNSSSFTHRAVPAFIAASGARAGKSVAKVGKRGSHPGFPGDVRFPPHRTTKWFGWKGPRRPPGPNPVPWAGTPATSPVTNRHQKGSSSRGYFHIKCPPPVPSHLGERALHKGRGQINIIFQKRNGRFPLPKHFRAIFFFFFFRTKPE